MKLVHHFQPGAPGSKAPTLLLLHGTGGDEHSLLDLGRTLLPGAPMLSPRGNVLEHGMPRFFHRLAEGVFDEPDLIQRTHELADFVAAAAVEYHFAAQDVVAIGYSNGANIAASMLLLRPGVIAGAVLLRAMVPLHLATPPEPRRSKVLLVSGAHDEMITGADAEELGHLLRAAGAEVTHQWSDAGHQLTAPEISAAKQWLAENFTLPAAA